jgi:hypothetical protein
VSLALACASLDSFDEADTALGTAQVFSTHWASDAFGRKG